MTSTPARSPSTTTSWPATSARAADSRAVWRESELFADLRRPQTGGRLHVVLGLRRLPRRLHGGQVLHRPAARRPRPRVREGPRRTGAACVADRATAPKPSLDHSHRTPAHLCLAARPGPRLRREPAGRVRPSVVTTALAGTQDELARLTWPRRRRAIRRHPARRPARFDRAARPSPAAVDRHRHRRGAVPRARGSARRRHGRPGTALRRQRRARRVSPARCRSVRPRSSTSWSSWSARPPTRSPMCCSCPAHGGNAEPVARAVATLDRRVARRARVLPVLDGGQPRRAARDGAAVGPASRGRRPRSSRARQHRTAGPADAALLRRRSSRGQPQRRARRSRPARPPTKAPSLLRPAARRSSTPRVGEWRSAWVA